MMKERRSSSACGASFEDRKEHAKHHKSKKMWLGEPFHIHPSLKWMPFGNKIPFLIY